MGSDEFADAFGIEPNVVIVTYLLTIADFCGELPVVAINM